MSMFVSRVPIVAGSYTCPIVNGFAWMPRRKGAVSGFVVAGFGAGAAVFNGVATAWVNPHDEAPNKDTGFYDKASKIKEVKGAKLCPPREVGRGGQHGSFRPILLRHGTPTYQHLRG